MGDEQSADNSDEPLFKEAKAEREAFEKVNNELKQNLEIYRKIKNEEILSGRTFAGKQEAKKEETPVEYRQRIDKEIREGTRR